jgi:hypothetical protein
VTACVAALVGSCVAIAVSVGGAESAAVSWRMSTCFTTSTTFGCTPVIIACYGGLRRDSLRPGAQPPSDPACWIPDGRRPPAGAARSYSYSINIVLRLYAR